MRNGVDWQLICLTNNDLTAPLGPHGWAREHSFVAPNSGSFARQNLNICLLLSDLVEVCLCIFANWIESGRDPQRLSKSTVPAVMRVHSFQEFKPGSSCSCCQKRSTSGQHLATREPHGPYAAFLAICILQIGMRLMGIGDITARPASRAHSCTFAMVHNPAPLLAPK